MISFPPSLSLSPPVELQNSFDIFHRCLAVVYGTFFLNLYTKANAPCLLCHGCKSLYPPGQFIHHACPALPPNIVPCRSRMWRRCLIPLVSAGIDKAQQKQRWKYVLEKFSHSTSINSRRNPIPPEAEAQLLDMPECKRGRFTAKSHRTTRRSSVNSAPLTRTLIVNVDELEPHVSNGDNKQGLLDLEGCVNVRRGGERKREKGEGEKFHLSFTCRNTMTSRLVMSPPPLMAQRRPRTPLHSRPPHTSLHYVRTV